MKTKACPKKCAFDWADFHSKLDWAMAHWIEESERGLTNTNLIEFMQYSAEKKKLGANS